MVVIGIDFGTTYSCTSYFDGNKIKVIQNEHGNYTTSTSVGFSKDSSEILFGYIQRRQNYSVLSNFKRLIGITFTEFINNKDLVDFFNSNSITVVRSLENDYCSFNILYNGIQQNIDISDLTKMYIKYLLNYTRNVIKNIKDVVITVPVYFNDTQRSILKNYFESLELNVIRIINEPTAAALAYSMSNENDKEYEKILVVDSGGGTTDFSILEMDYTSQIYRVVDVVGDNFLGGEDITKLLSEFIKKEISRYSFTKTPKHQQIIIKEAERIKQSLSFIENTQINIDEYEMGDIRISRNKFEYICDEFFEKFRKLLENFIKPHVDIDKIIFVGGTTRIPKIVSICSRLLPNATINNMLNPDHTISIGASIQGHLLCKPSNTHTCDSDNDILLLDVTSMSLGVESDNGLMNVIIPKNTTIPVQNTMYFTNENDYMSEIDIEVYQGERKLIKYNSLLTTLKLSGLDSSLLSGQMNIKIDFNVDSDGILSVVAHEKNSDILNKITLDKLYSVNEHYTELDPDTIFDDTYVANQIKLRNILYKTFKELLIKFREKEYPKESFELKMTNKLFNEAFDIISKYTDYSPDELVSITEQFRLDFHNIHIVDSFDDII